MLSVVDGGLQDTFREPCGCNVYNYTKVLFVFLYFVDVFTDRARAKVGKSAGVSALINTVASTCVLHVDTLGRSQKI